MKQSTLQKIDRDIRAWIRWRTLGCVCSVFIMVGCAHTEATATRFRTQANIDYCKWTGGANPTLEMRGVNHSEATRAGVEYVRVIGGALVPLATGAFGGGNAAAAGASVPLLESMMRNRRLPIEQQTIFDNGRVIRSQVR